jgi:hypothetical protein
MYIVMGLLFVATVCFFMAILDKPTGTSARFIAAGLFLMTLSMLIGMKGT